ncbi:hypothetical protein PHMEG_00020285 [Phytophthora megakarya]|uniref:BZIP domain-containing protein n=1 Tax=Phytophthora megakarya TaxID=4795 RepID=A0A225VPQ8_9STRA|nr:hypothetical protein PHMEG_00020285 [Phytophthora megakarya]
MESLYANDGSAAASPPVYRPHSFSYASPPSSQAWHSPSAYSSDGASSPASDAVSVDTPAAHLDQDWEILSDILINDALNSLPPPSVVNLSPRSSHLTQNSVPNPQFGQSEATPASPFTGALPAGYSSSSSVNSAPDAVQVAPRAVGKAPGPKKVARGRGRSRKVDGEMKKEPLTLEEQKKQRRRSQIASSVQRHREKKKCLVSSLQAELAGLTTQLATLRAQRRAQLADNDQLVAYEEEAMTQRRKRKQSEQDNQVLKQALFQQTAFLGGMRALMGGGGLPCSKTLEFHDWTLEFHDWVHSYTALASRDALARRKEYVAHFPQSKMELATKLVLKNTEEETQRLIAMGEVYMGHVKMLHDGTRDALEMTDGDVMMRELFGRPNSGSQCCTPDESGDGQVIKEFTSVFLFKETAQCTLDTLIDFVFTSMRSIGVYYPGSVYQSRSVDEVYHEEDDGVTKSRVYYTDIAATMEPILEIVDEPREADEIKVEARVITREQRSRDEGMILWDYVDNDSLHPMPVHTPGRKTIRRNVCGGMLIRREPGTGMLSVRHTSIKGYCPLAKPKESEISAPETLDAEEAQRAVSRRIALQATEYERIKDRCTRYVFNDITSRLNSLHVS